ncbi:MULTISPECIES: hypothetical protein [Rhizobium]|uniref:FHA domain-containing protein n=1 Tax=Rhizobium aouanii TaxID=3118145 RepID=A0ABU8CW95_9HYPH|nr:hypothetical protein [Rhizobium acaciae]MCW1754164.1 hypothetical protein [Rhizobium acaciae]
MRIVSALAEHGSGHAWLDIGMPAAAGMRVTVERDAEKNCFLGPHGWQNLRAEIAAIEPPDGRRANSLLLGPNIVDHLKDGDFVTISVGGTGFAESDFWPPIPISGRKARGDGMVGVTPGPIGKKDTGGPKPPGPGGGKTIVDPPIGDPGPGPGPGIEPPARRHFGWIAALVILAIALVGGGIFAVRFLPEGTLDNLQARITSTVDNLRDMVFPPPPEPPTDWSAVLRDPSSTPEKLYQSAIDTRSGPQTLDLSHELLYQAALRGNVQAQKDYSRLYDPTVTETTGWTGRKNARTALEYYRKLQDGGDQAAGQDIRRICDFLKPDIFVNAESRTAFDDYCS